MDDGVLLPPRPPSVSLSATVAFEDPVEDQLHLEQQLQLEQELMRRQQLELEKKLQESELNQVTLVQTEEEQSAVDHGMTL